MHRFGVLVALVAVVFMSVPSSFQGNPKEKKERSSS